MKFLKISNVSFKWYFWEKQKQKKSVRGLNSEDEEVY